MREERNLTGDALAAAARVPPWRITALEEGQLDPDYDLLLRLAAAMGTRASEFVIRANRDDLSR
jgi:transcriptional regulator with XRE-family HTH domain